MRMSEVEKGENIYMTQVLMVDQRTGTDERTEKSPAQLVHDFKGLPHVPWIESDGTLSLYSIFFVQNMWTKPSAPEVDSTHTHIIQTHT